MVIKIAVPIKSGSRLTGVLYAAVLLNNNTEFIDRFKRLVFKREKLRGKDIGTTPIFLGDIRVATNVVDGAGRRAIGTQVSEEVYQPVKRLIAASKEMAQGIYHRIEIDPHDDDDARNLGQAFNGMVEAIEERDRELKDQAARTILKFEKLASIGRLASGITHKINNPLTAVLTYSRLLLEDMKGTKYEEDLTVIRDETMRCRGIVRGLLDFARDTKPERALSDLNLIIEDSLRILEKHVSFQNIEIVKALDRPLPRVTVDPGEIRSVINNLAVNAADAMPNSGRLTITTSAEPEFGMVVISVADTGAGISEENMCKIFGPFFTTKGRGQGTGLGLAMTYGVIQRHGGLISVESNVGEGTKFTIKLPPQ